MTTASISPPRPVAGVVSFVLGSLSLLIVLTHFWVGPFAPQQRVGVTVGDVAASMRQAAVRKLKGLPQPEKVAAPWTTDKTLNLIASLLAGFALIAGGVSYIRRENRRAAVAGAVLGAGAITFQLFVWAILLLAGAVIIYGIVQNVPGILGD